LAVLDVWNREEQSLIMKHNNPLKKGEKSEEIQKLFAAIQSNCYSQAKDAIVTKFVRYLTS
jgi:hypothetical protein